MEKGQIAKVKRDLEDGETGKAVLLVRVRIPLLHKMQFTPFPKKTI